MSDLAFGKHASVETNKIDRYGRSVGVVFVDRQDVNLEQVKRGMAWHYKQYQREQSSQDQVGYAAAELEAKVAKRGLWQDATPQPPWEFRHEGRK